MTIYVTRLPNGAPEIHLHKPKDRTDYEIHECETLSECIGLGTSVVNIPQYKPIEPEQISALAERQAFLEDCIAEMALSIYN